MSEIVEIKTKKDLSSVASGFTGHNGVADLSTTDKRVYAFNNAENIVDSVYKRERQGAISLIRSEALMLEKKSIMGDLWNANKAHVPEEYSVKWNKFTEKLDNASDDRIRALLVFADYHETSKFTGVKHTAPNQGQFNALAKLVNKKTGTKELTPVVRMYDTLVKENGGKEFGSAKEVVSAFNEFTLETPKKKTKPEIPPEEEEEEEEIHTGSEPTEYLPHIFAQVAGDEPKTELNNMTLAPAMVGKLTAVSKDEWKSFYREAAKVFHSDKGGSGFEILNGLNQMMSVFFTNQKQLSSIESYKKDYSEWKTDNGFTDDWATVEEVNKYESQ